MTPGLSGLSVCIGQHGLPGPAGEGKGRRQECSGGVRLQHEGQGGVLSERVHRGGGEEQVPAAAQRHGGVAVRRGGRPTEEGGWDIGVMSLLCH